MVVEAGLNSSDSDALKQRAAVKQVMQYLGIEADNHSLDSIDSLDVAYFSEYKTRFITLIGSFLGIVFFGVITWSCTLGGLHITGEGQGLLHQAVAPLMPYLAGLLTLLSLWAFILSIKNVFGAYELSFLILIGRRMFIKRRGKTIHDIDLAHVKSISVQHKIIVLKTQDGESYNIVGRDLNDHKALIERITGR